MEDPAGKKSILIVDDEAPFRFAAGVALRRKGYRVSEAGDGKQALAAVLDSRRRGEPFDLVVTDIRMPELSGIELIDALKDHGVSVPLCAITCFGDAALVGELSGKGCRDYLEKPFEPEELVVWIGTILRRGE
jgi:phosphoserine phosphatase RsbU/P